MTPERELLIEALAAIEEIHTDQCSAWCGYRELRSKIRALLATEQPENPAGDTTLKLALARAMRGYQNLAEYVLRGPYAQECREHADAIAEVLAGFAPSPDKEGE